ncbi:hypothetical protein ABL78_4504 [Leptomonas seymouri]|uniref:Uncharacterized protein n=1 Tax=Leptomonas seymouri TaxID=5684 RepID=A0A0N1PD00_LEPSE|nr:hypothetical protein ABL78_4504 [Leptomonas seymouri]|eukprot:KPI86425.1 hypothetical protein ABL78_4504 [Leptomonas seymouri]
MSSPAHSDLYTEAREPAPKRVATEAGKSNNHHHPSVSQAEPEPSTPNARAHFLRVLEQCASDDEDEAVAIARSRGHGAVPSPRGRTLPSPLHASFTPPPASSEASDSSGFFFGHTAQYTSGSDHNEAVDDDGFAVSTGGSLKQRNGPTVVKASAPSRIGLSLLHRMHAESMSADSGRSTNNANASKSSETRGPSSATFETVYTYVPLSTGGFLSTATAGEDLMEGRQVRVGDVLSLRKPPNTTPSSLNAPVTSFLDRPRLGSNPATPNSSVSPSLPPPPTQPSPALISADRAHKTLSHFKPAASFTDNDKEYGMRLSPDMVRCLFEVTRVDPQGRSVEALFLDGTRVKLPFHSIRPAGYDEQKRYAQWKTDPSSRPVATIHSGVSSPTSASARGAHPVSPVDQTSQTVPTGDGITAVSADSWWVIPRLLVRIATEAAGDWYGKKCVVKAVRRNENAIRLTEWQDEAQHARGNGSSGAAEMRELIGVDGLETVVPRKGGRAMIVLGPQRGEMCTVRSRVRGPDGGLTGVEVEMRRTKEVVTLRAEDLCALDR